MTPDTRPDDMGFCGSDGEHCGWMDAAQGDGANPAFVPPLRSGIEPVPVSTKGFNRGEGVSSAIESSARILAEAVERFSPTHIVSMVSGGYDSAASDQIARELGANINFVMHGNTRCGIPETTEFVRATYSALGDYVEADAGTAYEDYVLRKGFFGKGIAAHGFSYRVLKAQPFRKEISKHIRQGKRDVRVLLLNGARKDESENRRKHLEVFRRDPASPGNIWVNLIHDWGTQERDDYLRSRCAALNPVARELCRSGECMCGTMQTQQERGEAAAIFPKWGAWLSSLETEARRLHGFGWGEPFPKPRDTRQADMFQPLCKDCLRDTDVPEAIVQDGAA